MHGIVTLIAMLGTLMMLPALRPNVSIACVITPVCKSDWDRMLDRMPPHPVSEFFGLGNWAPKMVAHSNRDRSPSDAVFVGPANCPESDWAD